MVYHYTNQSALNVGSNNGCLVYSMVDRRPLQIGTVAHFHTKYVLAKPSAWSLTPNGHLHVVPKTRITTLIPTMCMIRPP